MISLYLRWKMGPACICEIVHIHRTIRTGLVAHHCPRSVCMCVSCTVLNTVTMWIKGLARFCDFGLDIRDLTAVLHLQKDVSVSD
ncbi:uncharacterized protein K489DRAFT_129122 [Dissoconium aciculare CBS 342.82]|uniref:Uncharacterized protein n=1 Tax=Dissoconium aciculare CBS 342.82 TaxID=1314786 RepID=A0A6J3LSN5_9PEZI|nr:uncharacterized protein K489DRAFT_129122 [Dissoconium aciculare CBS 342.82]KAF1818304.1 hypothetical protein K489DRAFT_129122 [Dissoconium aciculare CBS 342.82]